ncbi:toxin-antitoxin system YwqK family antitoxin [Streptomyces sp. NPDC093097]|uniref:toxin-antitoxin system YwqK family antitoxin n=1 Tax=Streptomyces sp. NPDC093097 TaxID=3366027 RepID=UPI0038258F61
MTPALRIDVDGPDVDMDDAQRLLYRGEPFTGEVAEHQSGHLISLDEYTDGILNGHSREWYQDGTLRSEGIVRDGQAVGEFKEWHPNGALKSRKFFDSSIASLREEDTWDEHGVQLTSWRRNDT